MKNHGVMERKVSKLGKYLSRPAIIGVVVISSHMGRGYGTNKQNQHACFFMCISSGWIGSGWVRSDGGGGKERDVGAADSCLVPH